MLSVWQVMLFFLGVTVPRIKRANNNVPPLTFSLLSYCEYTRFSLVYSLMQMRHNSGPRGRALGSFLLNKLGEHLPERHNVMNMYPTGISQSDLQFVVRMVNGSIGSGEPWTLGHALYEINADESVLTNNASYWFLFDNLNRIDAQLLWVWRRNYLRTGISPFWM